MDLNEFWFEWDDGMTNPVAVTTDMVEEAERVVGYVLPASYLAVLARRNGGKPANACFPTDGSTSWADDHIEITGICGIGGKWGIDSDELGSRFMIREWGYPAIGIVVAHCPSGGHDAVMLDYSKCGPRGEPRVVHVDVEADEPIVTFLAKDFLTFIEGLVDCEGFEEEEESRAEWEMRRVERGSFSPLLQELCAKTTLLPNPHETVRAVAKRIVEEKGDFVLHERPIDDVMYDLLFALYTSVYTVERRAAYAPIFMKLIVERGVFSVGGFAEGFLSRWFQRRLKQGALIANTRTGEKRLILTEGYTEDLLSRLQDPSKFPVPSSRRKAPPTKAAPKTKAPTKKAAPKTKTPPKKATPKTKAPPKTNAPAKEAPKTKAPSKTKGPANASPRSEGRR